VQVFDELTGYTHYIYDTIAASNTVTMPAQNITVTATFKPAPPSTHSISGTVSGDIAQGVVVSTDAAHSATTDASGNYTISGLADGAYTVTPALTGYTFTPATASATLSGADVTGIDFVGTKILNQVVAVDDKYSVIADNILTVSPVGILENDLFPSSVNVTLVNDVTDGILILNNDGSFTYTPNRGFVGEDSFSYSISDGTFPSSTAVVSIIVNAFKVTLGMRVEIAAVNVDKLPGTSFLKPPKIYGTVNSGGKIKKVALKKDKSSSSKVGIGIWKKKTPIYDKKAVKSGYNSYISTGKQSEQIIQLMISGKTEKAKFKDIKINKVLLVPPEITQYTLDGLNLKIEGNYFGYKPLKVMLEPISGGKVIKLKVDKSAYNFDYKSSESSLSASFKPGKVPPGDYYIIIDNKIGIGVSYDATGNQYLPVITIQ
jgi:hypothetical protein